MIDYKYFVGLREHGHIDVIDLLEIQQLSFEMIYLIVCDVLLVKFELCKLVAIQAQHGVVL